MAEQDQAREVDVNPTDRQRAVNAFQRMKSLAQGMTASQATRTARRLSRWANPNHAQWKDINKDITKEMIKTIWPCDDAEIKKGRWKISKCQHEEIKANAEKIYLEIYGHPLHNADCALYFAKMLYAHFVLQRPVDFSSKETTVATHDIREHSVTFTREELALIIEGAEINLKNEKDILKTQLVEKDEEISRLLNACTTPQASQRRMESRLDRIGQDVQHLTQRANAPPAHRGHISHLVLHPDSVPAASSGASSSSSQCPACFKAFDGWSGSYTLSCGHYYHLICLIRLMQAESRCSMCLAEIPQSLYYLFGMGSDYKFKQARPDTPSMIRNLFSGDEAQSDQQPLAPDQQPPAPDQQPPAS